MTRPSEERPADGVVGLVIGGGRSVRFGSEKATATLDGEPLLIWAVRRLQRSCVAVAVNARPGTATERLARAQDLPVLHDAAGDAAGPLAGVKVGLAWAARSGAQALATSPCDAPLLPADLFPRLIAAAGAGAAMAETADGLQPLCAIWPVTATAVVNDALRDGAHPATWRLLERIAAVHVRFDDAQAFANINTPAELAALAQRAERLRIGQPGTRRD